MARLGDLLKIEASSKNVVGDKFWLLNLDMVEQQTGNILDYNYVGKDALNGSIIQFDTNCVLYSKLRPNLNKVVIPNQAGFATSEMLALRPNTKLLSREYLAIFLRSESFVTWATSKTAGAKMPRLGSKELLSKEIPLPTLSEQTQISARFTKINDLISLRKEQLAKLDLLTKSRFIEMFGGFERTTTIARYISELRGGKSLAGTEPCKNKVLKTGAATFGWFDPEQYKYLPTDYEPLPEHKVETGDVIISRMNTPELVGACSYVFDAPEDMYYPDRLWKAVLKENTNPIFLWQLLWNRDIRRDIKESSGGTSGTMHNISKTNLLAIKCMDAPIELQDEYAAFVQQIDISKFDAALILQERIEGLRTLIQQSLEETKRQFDVLMQAYFK